MLDMELFLESYLAADTTAPITSPSRQSNPVWIDEDSGIGMELVRAYLHYHVYNFTRFSQRIK